MADPRGAPSLSLSGRTRDSGRHEVDIGMFRRKEEIGKGSFATVYKASVSKKPGFVAIKSVDLHRLNKKLKENLYSEIHILKGLHHPHIVSLIDCKETSAHIHLIMEFCELGDLSYFIKKKDSLHLHETMKDMIAKYPNPPGGGLNEVIVRHLLKQLANAIEFLRSKNFIHRDVKPQNLLLDPSPHYYSTHRQVERPFIAHERSLAPNVGIETLPTLKLADFGFARSLPSTSLAETLCGSPLYMAPEILRYEKYDARVDLWSIGTVLYEMLVGKPPFKASNHVELLRKIEKSEDRIAFPSELHVSDSLKKLVRGLLKRHPELRMSFHDLFNHTVIKDEIPGLVDEDRSLQIPRPRRSSSNLSASERLAQKSSTASQYEDSREAISETPPSKTECMPRRPKVTSRRASLVDNAVAKANVSETMGSQDGGNPRDSVARRASVAAYATSPNTSELSSVSRRQHSTTMARRLSGNALSPQERVQQRERTLQIKDIRERAAQDVAFERDYVVVEKRAVEVNAFADELAASPRIHGSRQEPARMALTRRATQQGPPNPTTGAQHSPSRAIQTVSGKRPESSHDRRNSYERRLRDQTSATSAISKAISLASGRLFGIGFSPPLGMGKVGASPPFYGPFPAYPPAPGGLLMIAETPTKNGTPLDEETRIVLSIEESATRSDVVFGFAEVKYKQLIPLAPSMDNVLGMHQQTEDSPNLAGEGELTISAMIMLSEEALVLYVKALSILARAMDNAGAWWAKRSSGELFDVVQSTSPSSTAKNHARVGTRINNVVQWIRSRFNETLEKAEFVGLKLRDAQSRSPNATNASNVKTTSDSSAAATTQTSLNTRHNLVIVTSGITAEKLMYDRALEMSRSAAVNELVGEDLPGCELAYVTAMRMLEAILEDDDEVSSKSKTQADKNLAGPPDLQACINGVEPEDRKVVIRLVESIGSRLQALQKKMRILSARSDANQRQTTPSPPSKSTSLAVSPGPAIGSTPPR